MTEHALSAVEQSGGNPYVAWVRSVYNYVRGAGLPPDPRGIVTPADIAFEGRNTGGVLGTIAWRLRGREVLSDADRQAQEIQTAALLNLRPAAQLTREPVPIPVSVPGPPTPPGPTPTVPPEIAPRPVQAPARSDLEEFARLLGMANGFGDIGNILGELSGLVGNVGNAFGRPAQAFPMAFSALPPAVRAIGGAVGGGVVGAGVAGLLGGGGGGAPTALQRIKADSGRNVTRKTVIRMARTCGLEMTAQILNTDVTLICEVVSKGMPRRGRGISSRDMSRTRSTLGKLNSMQRSLSGLCPTPRRRRTK